MECVQPMEGGNGNETMDGIVFNGDVFLLPMYEKGVHT